MNNLESMSIEQLVAIFFVNGIGVVCLGTIFILVKKNSSTPKGKISVSVCMGMIGVILLGTVLGDLGIYFWLESGDFQSVTEVLPIFSCLIPFVFLTTTVGTYIQLIYKDKIQGYVDSASKKKPH